MNLMIASDIHGSARYCRDLLAAFDREGVELTYRHLNVHIMKE